MLVKQLEEQRRINEALKRENDELARVNAAQAKINENIGGGSGGWDMRQGWLRGDGC
jgi:hypothetical protein